MSPEATPVISVTSVHITNIFRFKILYPDNQDIQFRLPDPWPFTAFMVQSKYCSIFHSGTCIPFKKGLSF